MGLLVVFSSRMRFEFFNVLWNFPYWPRLGASLLMFAFGTLASCVPSYRYISLLILDSGCNIAGQLVLLACKVWVTASKPPLVFSFLIDLLAEKSFCIQDTYVFCLITVFGYSFWLRVATLWGSSSCRHAKFEG